MAVSVPLSSDLHQRHLAHEDGVLVLLNVKVLQVLHDLQLVLCEVSEEKIVSFLLQPVGGDTVCDMVNPPSRCLRTHVNVQES